MQLLGKPALQCRNIVQLLAELVELFGFHLDPGLLDRGFQTHRFPFELGEPLLVRGPRLRLGKEVSVVVLRLDDLRLDPAQFLVLLLRRMLLVPRLEGFSESDESVGVDPAKGAELEEVVRRGENLLPIQPAEGMASLLDYPMLLDNAVDRLELFIRAALGLQPVRVGGKKLAEGRDVCNGRIVLTGK